MRVLVLALSLSVLFGYPSIGRALTGGPVEGQVLDYDTGAPVAGAFVAARWEGDLLSGRTVCAHVETAVSDSGGHYRIGPWTQQPTAPVDYPVVILGVYKAGYKGTFSPLKFVGDAATNTWVVFHRDRPDVVLQTFSDRESAKQATHPTNVYVKRFVGTPSERVQFIRDAAFASLSCGSGGASQRNLYPLQRAAFAEAKALATTAYDQKLLTNMRVIAEDDWLALPPDAQYPEKRSFPEQFIRDFQ